MSAMTVAPCHCLLVVLTWLAKGVVGAPILSRRDGPDVAGHHVTALATYGATTSSALKLNSHIFYGNVLLDDQRVDNWIVLWCVDWHEPCQSLQPAFEQHALEFQDLLNSGSLMNQPVRFARVDCAIDKPLCNEMGVEQYPTVKHYSRGKLVGSWASRMQASPTSRTSADRLTSFLTEQLLASSPAPQAVAASEWPGASLVGGGDAADLLLLALLLAANVVVVSRTPDIASVRPAKAAALADRTSVATADEEECASSAVRRVVPQAWRSLPTALATELEL